MISSKNHKQVWNFWWDIEATRKLETTAANISILCWANIFSSTSLLREWNKKKCINKHFDKFKQIHVFPLFLFSCISVFRLHQRMNWINVRIQNACSKPTNISLHSFLRIFIWKYSQSSPLFMTSAEEMFPCSYVFCKPIIPALVHDTFCWNKTYQCASMSLEAIGGYIFC